MSLPTTEIMDADRSMRRLGEVNTNVGDLRAMAKSFGLPLSAFRYAKDANGKFHAYARVEDLSRADRSAA